MADRKMRLLLSCTGLCLCALFLLAGLSRGTAGVAPSGPASAGAAAGRGQWIVGAFDGRLAVFLPDAAQPEEVYPSVRLAELPPEDRLLLERGIPVSSDAQLHRLLEDYLS